MPVDPHEFAALKVAGSPSFEVSVAELAVEEMRATKAPRGIERGS